MLANIVGKSYAQIFGEFEGNIDPRSAHGSGDVKYHLGASGDFTTPEGNTISTSVVANPSHLEAVDPVLEGVVRAKQDLLERGEEGFTVLPVLVHGDAAFAYQGVVAETLHLSQLRGYRTGGTVHIVVNNQVGFTTSPASSRSSVYATDVARMIQAPIFHVNGDDPEAVVRVGHFAYEYRQTFRKDVVIDMVCYRRRGHNEGDNPAFTQPLMYDLIDAKRSTRKLYTEALIGRGDITVEEAEQALRDYQEQLERAFTETREAVKHPPAPGAVRVPEPDELIPWSHEDTKTAISEEVVKRVIDTQLNLPEGFTVHPRLAPVIQRRGTMVAEDAIDWATGELLAFGSLLIDDHPVRLVGQDSRRGTFGQRHAVLVDRVTGEEHTPLKTFNHGTTKFYVYDSLLSEFAAMGFEYGYSVVRPDALVAWEAQFGDFANGAQSIIDEFISSGEQKWGQRSSVVLLLPHGYEGQGPDHSSARIERYLQLCAQDNMTVAQPSTPANYFHLLRWQVLSERRKPLIVFTPKSLLRLKAAASATSEFTSGAFRPVIGDSTVDPSAVRKIVVCSGRIYYDLLARREKSGRNDVALVRLERLYPFPENPLKAELARYSADAELLWAQDEPVNMGPWPYLSLKIVEKPDLLGGRTFRRVSRTPNSSLLPSARTPSTTRNCTASWTRSSAERGSRTTEEVPHARGGPLSMIRPFTGAHWSEACTSPTGGSRSSSSVAARRRSASAGSRSGCASSWTSTPSSRCPWSAWPPGSHAWTRTTDRRPPRPAGHGNAIHLDFAQTRYIVFVDGSSARKPTRADAGLRVEGPERCPNGRSTLPDGSRSARSPRSTCASWPVGWRCWPVTARLPST